MSDRISPSTSIQPHDLSIYQDFIVGAAKDDDVVLNVDKATSTVSGQAVTSGFQKLYRWLFGQKKSDIVQDFSAALEAKYGKDVVKFAFPDDQKDLARNGGLSKKMIKEAIENASHAKEAKNDLEMYADMARTNITLAQKACPEKNLIQENQTLREKFSTVQQFAGRSLKQFKNIDALNAALKDAFTVATTSKEVIEAVTKEKNASDLARAQELARAQDLARAQKIKAFNDAKKTLGPEFASLVKQRDLRVFTANLRDLETVAHSSQEAATAAGQEISSIKEKLIVDLKEIEPDQLLSRDASSSPSDTAAMRYAMKQTARAENKQIESQNGANVLARARAQLTAAAAMAPQQTILTEARCSEYLYGVTRTAHELATANKEVSAVTTNMVASADQKVALAHTILAHATAAEEAAKKIAAAPSAGIPEMMMASQIFYVAEQAKLMALSPNNAIETLNLKKELEKIHSSLAQLATSPELHHDHAAFLLAETRSPEEAATVAQGISRRLSQASMEMQESAANTEREIPLAEPEHQEGLTLLLHQQKKTTTLLQQAASCYAMLSCCKEIETHRTLFHEELRTFSDLVSLDDGSAQATLAHFTAIEDLISKEEISFPALNIDHLEGLEQSAKIIGLNGEITRSPADYAPTREDYKDGINLVRLSIAQKFGIDAVSRFDQNFEAKIQANNPLTIGELSSFITKEKSTGAAIYFITPVSSLEALRDQLRDVDDHKIIRSDSRVDDFNPFEPPQEGRALRAAPHTPAQNNQQGIDKALAVVLGTIETKEENNLEVTTMTKLFKETIKTESKKKNQEPMTAGELKAFLDAALRLRSSSSYMSRHFKHYLRSEKAAETFSDAIAWHAAGLSSEAVLASAAGMMHVPEPFVFSLGILAYLTAVYLNRPAGTSSSSTHH